MPHDTGIEDNDDDDDLTDDGDDCPELASTSLGNLSNEEIEDRNHELARHSNLGLQRILLPEGATKGDAIQTLSRSIPENEFGLPTFFYRSDMLPFPLTQLTQDTADAAVVVLDYSEGYPQYQGKTWWFQLPHESYPDYIMFDRYLAQAEEHGLRQLHLLSMDQKVPLDRVTSLAQEYYWTQRARAYDLFNVAADRKRRELRARRMENEHYKTAEALLEPLKRRFEEEDFFSKVEAKEAIEILRLLVNIQRVSTGLAQNGNAGKQDFNPDAARGGRQLMEDITRGVESFGDGMGIDANLHQLLQDPTFSLEAQKLIFRVRRGDNNDGSHRTSYEQVEGTAAVVDEGS